MSKQSGGACPVERDKAVSLLLKTAYRKGLHVYQYEDKSLQQQVVRCELVGENDVAWRFDGGVPEWVPMLWSVDDLPETAPITTGLKRYELLERYL